MARKETEEVDNEQSHDDADGDDSDQESGENEQHQSSNDDGDDKDQINEPTEEQQPKQKKTKKKKKVHKLSLKKTEDFNKKLRKRGVIYIARVPPKMTPTKVKALLSEFSEVTRVYLVEEDPTIRKRRKKNGGGGGKRYVEGWIELASKTKAKQIAMSLNNTPISMHKRNPHFGDLWNLKYLSKFKWSHLTEKVAYERRVREQKLRVEMMQARKENAAYVQMVETGKKMDRIEERKRKRGDVAAEVSVYDNGTKDDKSKKKKHKKKYFDQKHRQNMPIDDVDKKATKSAVLAGLV